MTDVLGRDREGVAFVPAEEAVARLLRSDWFLPAYTALRFYLQDHPDTVLRDWFTAANLPE
jgi:hypothetical protein